MMKSGVECCDEIHLSNFCPHCGKKLLSGSPRGLLRYLKDQAAKNAAKSDSAGEKWQLWHDWVDKAIKECDGFPAVKDELAKTLRILGADARLAAPFESWRESLSDKAFCEFLEKWNENFQEDEARLRREADGFAKELELNPSSPSA